MTVRHVPPKLAQVSLFPRLLCCDIFSIAAKTRDNTAYLLYKRPSYFEYKNVQRYKISWSQPSRGSRSPRPNTFDAVMRPILSADKEVLSNAFIYHVQVN